MGKWEADGKTTSKFSAISDELRKKSATGRSRPTRPNGNANVDVWRRRDASAEAAVNALRSRGVAAQSDSDIPSDECEDNSVDATEFGWFSCLACIVRLLNPD